MKALLEFAQLFAEELYASGFHEHVQASGLASATDLAEARVSLAYIAGAGRALTISNDFIKLMYTERGDHRMAREMGKKACIAERMASHAGIVMTLIVQGVTDERVFTHELAHWRAVVKRTMLD